MRVHENPPVSVIVFRHLGFIMGGAGKAIVSRNIADFTGVTGPVMTREDFLAAFP